jgi:hypothetical protein
MHINKHILDKQVGKNKSMNNKYLDKKREGSAENGCMKTKTLERKDMAIGLTIT